MTARSAFWVALAVALGLSFTPSYFAGLLAFGAVCMAVGIAIGGTLEWQR